MSIEKALRRDIQREKKNRHRVHNKGFAQKYRDIIRRRKNEI